MIDLIYSLEKNEYIEAQRLFVASRKRRGRIFSWIAVGVLGLAVGIIAQKYLLVWLILIGAALLGLITQLLLNPLLQRYCFGRRFRTEARFLTNVRLQVDHNGLCSQVDGIGRGTTEWTAFTSWIEGNTVFVMISGYLLRPISKRSLSSMQQDELRGLFGQHIGPMGAQRDTPI